MDNAPSTKLTVVQNVKRDSSPKCQNGQGNALDLIINS